MTSPSTTITPIAPGPVRMALLRAAYLLLGGGLAIVQWPELLEPSGPDLFEGVTLALLVALSILALIGLLRPLAMLPVLLIELLWKAIWIIHTAWPQYASGSMTEGTSETALACAFAIPIALVVPWDFVWRHLLNGTTECRSK